MSRKFTASRAGVSLMFHLMDTKLGKKFWYLRERGSIRVEDTSEEVDLEREKEIQELLVISADAGVYVV